MRVGVRVEWLIQPLPLDFFGDVSLLLFSVRLHCHSARAPISAAAAAPAVCVSLAAVTAGVVGR